MHYLKSRKRGRLLVVFHRKENSGSESFPAPGMDSNDRTRIWDLSDSNQGLQTPSTSVLGYIFFFGDIRRSPSFLEDWWSPRCSGCMEMVLNLFLNSWLPWASQFSLCLRLPFPSLKRISVIGFRTHPKSRIICLEILNLITPAKTLFPNKVMIPGYWDLRRTSLSRRHNSISTVAFRYWPIEANTNPPQNYKSSCALCVVLSCV